MLLSVSVIYFSCTVCTKYSTTIHNLKYESEKRSINHIQDAIQIKL